MGKRVAALLSATLAVLGGSCTPAVPLGPGDLRQLRAGSEIPVVYHRSPGPWVDCPGDEGEHVWIHGGSAMASPPVSGIATLASTGGTAGALLAGNVWQDYEDQWTASLREAPPDDAARATADAFLALSREAPGSVPFRQSPVPVESTDMKSLAGTFGPAPILVFETTRWVLVGCWFTYKPWFNVRATLLDLGSGRVLWRDSCGGVYPSPSSAEASPSELEARGKSLYASMIRARAQQCARSLSARFDGAK
jgi:hypothetical protein